MKWAILLCYNASRKAAGGRFGWYALGRMLLMDEIISMLKICESLYFVLKYILIICESKIIFCTMLD